MPFWKRKEAFPNEREVLIGKRHEFAGQILAGLSKQYGREVQGVVSYDNEGPLGGVSDALRIRLPDGTRYLVVVYGHGLMADPETSSAHA